MKNGGNARASFRLMDCENNNKISRADFNKGLEKLMINMSEADVNRVFDHLDIRRTGVLTYNEFCGLITDKQKKLSARPEQKKEERSSEEIEAQIKANLEK